MNTSTHYRGADVVPKLHGMGAIVTAESRGIGAGRWWNASSPTGPASPSPTCPVPNPPPSRSARRRRAQGFRGDLAEPEAVRALPTRPGNSWAGSTSWRTTPSAWSPPRSPRPPTTTSTGSWPSKPRQCSSRCGKRPGTCETAAGSSPCPRPTPGWRHRSGPLRQHQGRHRAVHGRGGTRTGIARHRRHRW